MDNELLKALLAGAPKKNRSTGYALVKRDGQLERVPLSEVDIGAFQGKAGTIRRSRKGAMRRQANGRRFYAPYGKSEVVAYLHKA
jgi:hypothetical protein